MDPMDAIRVTFFEECAELLESLEAGLLALHAGTQDADTVDAVFRAVHSIKGGAGAFGLKPLVAFSHEFETALDALRSGRLAPDAAAVSVFLRAGDQLGDLIEACRNGDTPTVPDTVHLMGLLAGTDDAAVSSDPAVDFAPVMLDLDVAPLFDDAFTDMPEATGVPDNRTWIVTFEPLPDLLISGNEPLFLFRALEVLGRIEVEALLEGLPPLGNMDPQVLGLRWMIRLIPSAPDLTETEIEAIFEFALDLCVLDICLAPAPTIALTSAPVTHQSATPPMEGLRQQPDEPGLDSLPRTEPCSPLPPDAPATPLPKPPPMTTIRVDLERVDRLVNLVGELVISQSMLAQGMMRAGLDQHSEAVTNLDDLQQLTRDMQDSVMSIRAQPVKSLFQRMTRIVREAAQSTGKDVRLETDGEGTEIDKTVVERLGDPLTHMIRNAIDHGLEDPKARAAAGKKPTGVVRLSARQQSDRVVIEVSDDGRGVDRDRVLERAIARGLVPAGKILDAGEIDRLLFLPGFSTSETVSSLSGRGVGMDVVQRAIRDLNGTIAITSTEGLGCAISISLPLTLAILDGMIVRSNCQRMVIPLSAIIETQTISAARIERLGSRQTVVQLHDRFVPMVDLAQGMGFPSALRSRSDGSADCDAADDDETALLFVQSDDSGPFAIRVDAIEAQRQVVIKGLGEDFGHVPCVSAATILGDGHVALIVDPAGIAATSGLQTKRPTPALFPESSLQ